MPYLNGKSAYEVAVENGYTGTEEEWLHSITPDLSPYITRVEVLKIVDDKVHCGDDFYPAIINKATFHKANEELKKRAADMNQTGKTRRTTPRPQTEFVLGSSQMHYDDPYEQAEYLYSLIESKVVKCQK